MASLLNLIRSISLTLCVRKSCFFKKIFSSFHNKYWSTCHETRYSWLFISWCSPGISPDHPVARRWEVYALTASGIYVSPHVMWIGNPVTAGDFLTTGENTRASRSDVMSTDPQRWILGRSMTPPKTTFLIGLLPLRATEEVISHLFKTINVSLPSILDLALEPQQWENIRVSRCPGFHRCVSGRFPQIAEVHGGESGPHRQWAPDGALNRV